MMLTRFIILKMMLTFCVATTYFSRIYGSITVPYDPRFGKFQSRAFQHFFPIEKRLNSGFKRVVNVRGTFAFALSENLVHATIKKSDLG